MIKVFSSYFYRMMIRSFTNTEHLINYYLFLFNFNFPLNFHAIHIFLFGLVGACHRFAFILQHAIQFYFCANHSTVAIFQCGQLNLLAF